MVDNSRSSSLDISTESQIKDKIKRLILDVKMVERLSRDNDVFGMRGMLETYYERVEAAFNAFKMRKNISEEIDNCRMVAKFFNDKINELQNNLLNKSAILYSKIEESYRIKQLYLVIALCGSRSPVATRETLTLQDLTGFRKEICFDVSEFPHVFSFW